MLKDHAGGDPLRVRKFTRRSLRNLAKDLRRHGHRASHTAVGKLLREQGYSPKANRKRYASTRHPERDRQFRYIARQKRAFLAAGLPVISIDTKKKELVGNFQQRGRRWCQEPEAVNTHDFKTDASAQAVPYGLYVLNRDRGYVRVGVSASTAEFAVDTIVSWWQTEGQHAISRTPSDCCSSRIAAAAMGAGRGCGRHGCRPGWWIVLAWP